MSCFFPLHNNNNNGFHIQVVNNDNHQGATVILTGVGGRGAGSAPGLVFWGHGC